VLLVRRGVLDGRLRCRLRRPLMLLAFMLAGVGLLRLSGLRLRRLNLRRLTGLWLIL
jgi:hypothetical protein